MASTAGLTSAEKLSQNGAALKTQVEGFLRELRAQS
jgi:hypothetical protein